MTRTMPIAQARENLTRLPEEFAKEPETGTVAVTRRGKPVLSILPWELYEAIFDTLEIMGDEDLIRTLREGIKDIQGRKGVPWERSRSELDLLDMRL